MAYQLKNLNKNLNIGDSIEPINNNFKDLQKFIANEKETINEVDNFLKYFNSIANKLEFACGFMEKNNSRLLNVWEDVLNKQDSWLKPLILFYPDKILDEPETVSQTSIQELICDWMHKNYKIKTTDIDPPRFIQGQTAIVYYLKGTKDPKLLNTTSRAFITCVTEDVTITANCESTRYGSACAPGCGCVNCAGVARCSVSKGLVCGFVDNGAALGTKRVVRYLEATAAYNNFNNFETQIPAVRLIVDECTWKIDNTQAQLETNVDETNRISRFVRILTQKPGEGKKWIWMMLPGAEQRVSPVPVYMPDPVPQMLS